MLGEQFRMSRRMSRTAPENFRLRYEDSTGMYRDKIDGSLWQSRELFDFGVGMEPGYYKLPLPSTAKLVELLFTAKIEDDYYGAASILLEEVAEEALPYFEAALQDADTYPHAAQRLKAVGLDQAVNRSQIIRKSEVDVLADYERWQSLAVKIASLTREEEKTSWLSRLFHRK